MAVQHDALDRDKSREPRLRPDALRKINLGTSLRRALRRLLSPVRLVRSIGLHRARGAISRTKGDDGLKLYAELLPGDFLHFGFFADPNTDPREISLADLERAQLAFTELFIERMHDKARPVLDVGCGMGGLSARLQAQGFVPVALTPDVHQIAHIEKKYPAIELVCGRFEDIDAVANAHRFGTIINSESLQYLDLEKTVKLVTQLLAPSGRWLIGDFFKTSAAYRGSGHPWDRFREVLAAHGLSIVHERDISANAGVTLRYIHMLADKVGLPVLRYGLGTLARKQPGVHALFEEFFDDLSAFAHERTDRLNPENQVRERRYLFVEVARADEGAGRPE